MKKQKKNKLIILIIITTIIITFFIAIKKKQKEITPITIESKHSCALDGMILNFYIGPKAQIIWKNGEVSFYCEAREVFYEWLDPITRKKIAKIFVENFDKSVWNAVIKYPWIEIQQAIFVIDNTKHEGAMFLSYVPFATIECAKKFQEENEGIILKEKEITKKVLQNSDAITMQRSLAKKKKIIN